MENSSCFDLETAISVWRTNLTSSSIGADCLLELESHLRDSVTSLRAAGHSEEDAFALASYRLGQAYQLREEFAKTHRESVWFERILWMLLGAQFFSFLTQFANLLRTLLMVPQMVASNSGLRDDPFSIWRFLWFGQYVILAGLLMFAVKRLQKRGSSNRFIEALRLRPRKWCGFLLAVSLSFGLLSLGSTLLPLFLHDLLTFGASQTHYDYSNLLMLVTTTFINAVILPVVTFWFLRQAESKTIRVA